LIQNNFFPAVIFSILFLDPNWIRIRIGIQSKMLERDQDPDPDEMNAEPQPWFWIRDPVLFDPGIRDPDGQKIRIRDQERTSQIIFPGVKIH
jgi:hypothetical protein